ncbi:MAG: hypothetical protein RI939_2 [Actinomycetota bacterium]|jgi:iron(III) transport system substrate-binding protein
MNIRKFAALALAATFTLAACGGTDTATDTTGAGGNSGDDTALTVYSGRSEELVGELMTAFETETGIEVNVRYGDSGELAALLLTEGDASPADVFFSQDAGALGAVEGLLAVLPQSALDAVDARYRAADGKWVGITGRVRVIVYNPELAPAPPTAIDGLLDPKWSGKIGYAPTNASWQSFVTALRVLRGEDGARDWLAAFAANKPVAFEKNGAVRDAVNDGTVALGLVNHYYLLEKIAAEGAAAVTAKNQFIGGGDPGGLVNVAGAGILASAPHQDAARRFVDFLQSATALEYFRTKTWEYILQEGAEQPGGLPDFATLGAPSIDLSDLSSLEETQELLQSVGLLTK